MKLKNNKFFEYVCLNPKKFKLIRETNQVNNVKMVDSTSNKKQILESNSTLSQFKPLISSSFGAIITSLLMTPLDVVKIRLQSQHQMMHKGDCFVYRNGLMDHLCTCFNGPESWYNRKIPGGKYTGTLDAMIKIVRAEGITSLWSGLPPTLLMAFPQVVLYFTTYDKCKDWFGYHEITNPNKLLPVLSGGFARIIAVTAVSPLELIRTKIQSERLNYNQISNAVKSAIEQNGFKSLYSGLVPTLWRDVPFSMIYWLNYETAKTYLLKRNKRNKLNSFFTFLCGAFAGSVAATITCPFDVVKTHRQIQLGQKNIYANRLNQNTMFIIKDILRTKGYKALFSGWIFFD